MTRRVFLHVGAPKTGTTYLQERLALNARTLAANGVHFPAGGAIVPAPLFHFRAALDLLGEDWGGHPGHAEGGWDALVRRVRRRSGSVVVSHEILAPAPAEAIAKAKHDLVGGSRSTELHVVCTVRDLARQVPAAWQEAVKQGHGPTYRRFLQRFERGGGWFRRALDLPAVLGAWGATLPPERVHVITVPPAGAGREVLWDRFLRTVGGDPAWAPLDTGETNPSLGPVETTVLRKLNRRLGPREERSWDLDFLVRELLAQSTLASSRSHPLQLAPSMLPWAEAETERWVEWLQGSGVHVVGDLDELRPLPIPDDERYVDPDRVAPRRQARVALAALAAMTLEAERRPDPDRQIVARAKSVARRRAAR